MAGATTLFQSGDVSRAPGSVRVVYAIEDKAVRDALLAQFPDGCDTALRGTYCESRTNPWTICWRVMHALPPRGANRPKRRRSLIQVQEPLQHALEYQAETYEYGIPPILCPIRRCSIFDCRWLDKRAEPKRALSGRARVRDGAGRRMFPAAAGAGASGHAGVTTGLAGPIRAIPDGDFSGRLWRKWLA